MPFAMPFLTIDTTPFEKRKKNYVNANCQYIEFITITSVKVTRRIKKSYYNKLKNHIVTIEKRQELVLVEVIADQRAQGAI